MSRRRIITVAITAAITFGIAIWGVLVPYTEVMGVIAAPGSTSIEVSDQPSAASAGKVTIDRVVTPRDAFVVVHQAEDGMPGMRVGYAPITRGETRELVVTLDPEVPPTANLIAAVHVDAGVRGVFEFDMDDMSHSPDLPFFIGGEEIATVFRAAK